MNHEKLMAAIVRRFKLCFENRQNEKKILWHFVQRLYGIRIALKKTMPMNEIHKIFFIYFFDLNSQFEADSFINFGSNCE